MNKHHGQEEGQHYLDGLINEGDVKISRNEASTNPLNFVGTWLATGNDWALCGLHGDNLYDHLFQTHAHGLPECSRKAEQHTSINLHHQSQQHMMTAIRQGAASSRIIARQCQSHSFCLPYGRGQTLSVSRCMSWKGKCTATMTHEQPCNCCAQLGKG